MSLTVSAGCVLSGSEQCCYRTVDGMNKVVAGDYKLFLEVWFPNLGWPAFPASNELKIQHYNLIRNPVLKSTVFPSRSIYKYTSTSRHEKAQSV